MIYVNNVKQKFRENTSQTPHGLSTDLPPQQNPTIPIDEKPLLFKASITCFALSADSTYIIHARLKEGDEKYVLTDCEYEEAPNFVHHFEYILTYS